MMSFLSLYGLFALKAFTIVVATLIFFAGILALARNPKPKLQIIPLNKQFEETKTFLLKEIGEKKPKKKKKKKSKIKLSTVYVIDFCGDIKASQVDQLRDEITAVLSVADKKDEVVIRLESPGGTVNGYGLAASQLDRIRKRQIPLTICIDKVAASGGYLMATVANKILAAPFAIVGSIGVVAQIPNFHRLLKKNNIDVEVVTAGEYKRTLTIFGENTEKGRKKFQEEIEEIHQQFINHIFEYREHLERSKIATGEHWLAKDAKELNLIDELETSDDYLMSKVETHQVFKVCIQAKQPILTKLLKPAMNWLNFLQHDLYLK